MCLSSWEGRVLVLDLCSGLVLVLGVGGCGAVRGEVGEAGGEGRV